MRVFVIGLALFLSTQTAVADPVASLVQAAGLRAVEESRPAADVDLPALDGQPLRLQEQRCITGPERYVPTPLRYGEGPSPS